MKIKDYNQMMRYLKSTGEFSRNRVKEKVREEDVSERIARMHHIYDGGPRPKHMDNPTIKAAEDMKKIKPIKQPVKDVKPVDIDVTGIDANLRVLEDIQTPPVAAPKTVKKKSEGLAYLLGIDE